MTDSPAISVVVPSYNHERFLGEALASALDSELNLEIVVVDDGSSDDSVALVRGLSEPRIRLLTQDNAGAHVALNRAVEASRGDIIFVLNSDDAYEVGRLETLLPRFEDPTVALAGTWLRVVGGNGEELAIKRAWHSLPPWPRPTSKPGLAELADPVLSLLETNYLATTSNIAFRRSLFTRQGLRFRNLRYAHDWCFFLEACLLGELVLVEQPLVRYRVHGDNTIREGQTDGQALMHFEILWLLARHSAELCRQSETRLDVVGQELTQRCWASLPRFACPDLLTQLLLWRGDQAVPATYDALLDPANPFRRQALAALSSAS